MLSCMASLIVAMNAIYSCLAHENQSACITTAVMGPGEYIFPEKIRNVFEHIRNSLFLDWVKIVVEVLFK